MPFMDNFREEVVVKRNRAANSMLYALCWVGMILFGMVALLALSRLMVADFSVFSIGGFLVFGGAVFLIWKNKDELRAEYEYTFTNGDLDIARVLGNVKRKFLTSLPVKNVEACGEVTHASFQRYVTMRDVKKHNWFLNRDGQLYYFYFNKNNQKHIVVIEPTQELMDMVKKYLQRGVWQG